MNREIKFRAWDNVNKRMGYFAPGFQWLDEYDVWHLTEADGNPNSSITDVPFGDNINLMQYTGLKDKNGKEIYEGDIVKSGLSSIRVIVWDKGAFHSRVPNWEPNKDMPSHPVNFWNIQYGIPEIIGNIFENPELIKENVSAQ